MKPYSMGKYQKEKIQNVLISKNRRNHDEIL